MTKITQRVKKILAGYESDNAGSKGNLAKILMHGKLGGTGKLSESWPLQTLHCKLQTCNKYIDFSMFLHEPEEKSIWATEQSAGATR